MERKTAVRYNCMGVRYAEGNLLLSKRAQGDWAGEKVTMVEGRPASEGTMASAFRGMV